MADALVSIIITNYNYSNYLPELFQSLEAQLFPTPLTEILFVDDASTDTSLSIAEELGTAGGWASFRIFQAGGKRLPGAVRNKGFTKARGDYIMHVDADDMLHPEFIVSCVTMLQQQAKSSIAYTGQLAFSEQEQFTVSSPVATAKLLAEQNVVTSCVMMHRNVWRQCEGFRTNTRYEDWDFWIQAAMHRIPFVRDPRPLYLYRQHNQNYSIQAQCEDGRSKASIVLNNRPFFPSSIRRWATDRLAEKPWAPNFPRGVIPPAQKVEAVMLAQRDLSQKHRSRAAAPA